ncbi:MAG: pyruvate kinase [Patescibacteria group bacterium]
MFRFTKIGATIGPACEDKATLEKMIKAGMNFARLNFAHGNYEWHEEAVKRIRSVAEKMDEPVAILQDLQGPRIRIGILPEAGVHLQAGEAVELDATVSYKSGGPLPIDQPDLHRHLLPGERILIDDGRIELKIKKIDGSRILTTVVEGGEVLSHKGINLPDSKLQIPAMSAKDREDLRFGVRVGVDMVGLSFVSNANDIIDVRFLIEQILKEEKMAIEHPIMIIAKIERHEAVDNLKSIIEAADGIMVARGDLGIELPRQEVPLIQKKIIDAARQAAKPVIVATQLLDSMRESPRPTRAEVSDVANAVIDHADALLLTNETAAGKFPAETVKVMSEIIESTEKSAYDDLPMPSLAKQVNTEEAISKLSRLLVEETGSRFILAGSMTGETGRLLSQVRPNVPIYVATGDELVRRQLNLSWGIRSFISPTCRNIEEFVERSIVYLKTNKLGKVGDKMIVVAGEPVGQAGNVNLLEVREIK